MSPPPNPRTTGAEPNDGSGGSRARLGLEPGPVPVRGPTAAGPHQPGRQQLRTLERRRQARLHLCGVWGLGFEIRRTSQR